VPGGGELTADNARSAQSARIAGLVHEAAPTERTVVAGARIEVVGSELDHEVFSTRHDGTFELPPVRSLPVVLEIKKEGFETSRISVKELVSDTRWDVAMKPLRGDVSLSRSGTNDCTDLPAPPDGVPGLREYARLAVHHDGELLVTAARLPFSSNEGYVYRLTANGWVKNDLDYILIRSALPLRGGFLYLVTFGGDNDLCGPWSVDLRHPN
jgi:hypothetical protein